MVEFDYFADIIFHSHGEYQQAETISKLKGVRKQTITFTDFDNVAA